MSNVIQLYPKQEPKSKDMDVTAFREDLIRPALKAANLWSQSAENLLLGTALAESELKVVKQFGGGPAVSFFQLEIETINDCVRYLSRYDKKLLKEKILTACYMDIFPPPDSATWNLRYAILMARIKYWMNPEPLPGHNSAVDLCKYYLGWYNTALGKGTIERAIHFFRLAVK